MKKQNLLQKLLALVVLISSFNFLMSCSSDDEVAVTPAQKSSIAKLASDTPSLSTLVIALKRTGVDLYPVLDAAGNYTVFAPTNAAFTTFFAGLGSGVDVNNVPVATLKQVLLNHVVSGRFTSVATSGATTLTTGYVKSLATFGGTATGNPLSMYINTAAGVKVNGVSTVTIANLIASNGVVHVVDAVIGLPTIVDHAKANATFSTLVTIVTSTTANGNGFGDQSTVATYLTTTATTAAPVTVFAPTNAAFAAATAPASGSTPAGWAAAATATQVTRVLQYHVTAAGGVLSTSLTQGQVIPMITTAPVLNTTVDLVGGPKIKDTQNISAAVVAADVQCANGVIHGIDKVLRPF